MLLNTKVQRMDYKSMIFTRLLVMGDVLGITPYELLSGLESDEYRKPDHAVIMRDSEEYYVIEGMRSLDADGRKRLMGYLDALRGMHEKKKIKKWEVKIKNIICF